MNQPNHPHQPLAERREGDRQMLREFAAMAPHDPARSPLRDRIITSHMPLVIAMAQRFRDRGEPLDDLIQVGMIGLVNAVDRFDPGRGLEFSTFATPTIIGEIKRHFRDRGGAIRIPRRLQESRVRVNESTEALATSLGRSPTVREVAAHSGLTDDEVLDALESAHAYSALSLDNGGGDDGHSFSLSDTLGGDDAEFEQIEVRETVIPLLAALDPRARRIVVMRFYENRSQSEIAQEMGISQMHVSRLLARSLAQMRDTLGADL